MGIGNCQREGKEFSSESRPSILGMKTVIADPVRQKYLSVSVL